LLAELVAQVEGTPPADLGEAAGKLLVNFLAADARLVCSTRPMQPARPQDDGRSG
jgi:hypothetical protein